jgi:hypothetical protein
MFKFSLANKSKKVSMLPEQTRLAIREVKTDPDDVVRIGSAKYLSMLCTPKNRHHLADPNLQHEVVDALDAALHDPNPRVQKAAREGLRFLRR